MRKRRNNAKESRKRKRGERFEQNGGFTSPTLFKMAERRPKAKYREMRGSPALFKMAKWMPMDKYREIRGTAALFKMVKRMPKAINRETREVRWRQKMCSKQDQKCSSDDTSVDRISMLPDELLGSILSRITTKEQIATSILSRRWRYLWTSISKLDFDAIDSLLRIQGIRLWVPDKTTRNRISSAFEKVKLDFLSRVNHVLASRCEGSTIKDFKVYFDLGKKDEGHINEWLRYALARKVQRLELNFCTTLVPPIKDRYVFPYTFFSHIDEEVGSSTNSIYFKQLKKISLNHVGVDSKAVEFFLHNCPLLEDLSVSRSPELLSLSVIGPFPSLKHLEISSCIKLDSLEICDVNLVCFKYCGRETRFLLRNLPKLAHISMSKSIFEYMKVTVPQFSSFLQQLEIFKMDLEVTGTSFVLPVEMSNLKQLEVVVILEPDESLLWLADLIQSAPCLQKFVLESRRTGANIPNRKLQRQKIKNLYPHLKEIEFWGFCGVPSDLEFVLHFVDNADGLKKILVDTKKTHEWLKIRKCDTIYSGICKDARDELQKQLALEKREIKLEYVITPI